MSVVGAFPGIAAFRRRTVRAEVNPLDKSTIVSIYPKEINEVKHTIQPGRFHIDPGTYENPSILVVGSSSWWREIDEEQPLLEIPNSSIQVAKSIVDDFCSGLIGFKTDEAKPGLFYVPGEFTVEKLRKEHLAILERNRNYQNKWYENLVRMTDILWARTNGSPLCVADDARMAAKALGLERDWTRNFQALEQVRCKACGSLRNPEYPICSICKAVSDPEKAAKLGLTFVK